MKKYFPNEVEPKWQKIWKEKKFFTPDMDKAEKPYYALMMFPYPSAEGLHVGNMYPYTGTDILARFKRMQGLDVFEPIGLDGFGIHSENYALKVNLHPMDLSKITEKRFYEQLTLIGDAYDWTRTVETYKPNYYKWTQWIFLKMYESGLAYKKKADVNFCPSCQTVLSDEQVISGECERCGSKVERKELEQWFFKITDYAEKLLKNLEWIDWSEKVKLNQRNWIGKSEGTLIKFETEVGSLEVFTTRPDTLFGATFLVISPEHPLLKKLLSSEQKEKVEEYIGLARKKSELERKENKEKSGEFIGTYAQNPLTGEKMPIWVADYVLMGYGTGAIMAVPAHDSRDFEFAKKFNLPIKKVIEPKNKKDMGDKVYEVYEDEGVLINSGEFTGLNTDEAKVKITNYLAEHQIGSLEVHYHLRDWLISRQRYWGPPIPIIYCDRCGTVPVPEEDLPVELPYIENFRPTGKSPLSSVPQFVSTKCPKCSGEAKRETDVSDTFLDSAWYFLRYPSTEFDDRPFDKGRTKKWMPVDIYIGGAEHSVLHLLYARFVTMVLHDLGYVDFEEPFEKFRAHGLIIRDGAKMSKSKGNVINPDKYINEYGADTFRMYLMFMGPFSEGGDFREVAISGIYRFLERVWAIASEFKEGEEAVEELQILHKTIKKVGEDIEDLHFNTAIASLMELLNFASKQKTVAPRTIKTFMLLLAPFAPHITEELWSILGEKGSIHQQSWPKFDSKYLTEVQVNVVIQINGKVRDQQVLEKERALVQSEVEKAALESNKVKKYLDGREIKKTIFVPGKVINFVV